MRVLFATGIYPPDIGGPATYVRDLARTLVGRGVGVEVVTYGDPEAGGIDDPFPVQRVPRARPLPARYAAFAAAARRAAARVDLVFAQDPLSAGLPARLAARLARKPLVCKVVGDLSWEIADDLGWITDGVDDFQKRRYGARVEALRRVQRGVVRSAREVIVPSRYVAGIVGGWGAPAERLRVVHNGVRPLAAPLPAPEDARRALGLPPGLVVASVGRLLPLKRFEWLIRATAALGESLPDMTLVLVGSGPSEAALRALAAELGVAGRVRFTGRLPPDQVRLHLRASDLFALVSTHEGYSHVVLEAMQAGVPVIATDVGGNREALADGQAGHLLGEASIAAVAEAVRTLWGSPGERARLREAGERRARESWPAVVEGTLAVFERALTEPRR